MSGRQKKQSQPEWQLHRPLISCLGTILADERMCDITFVFPVNGGREVSLNAHRLILAARSSVFESMFFGIDSKKVRHVEVTDVRAQPFKTLLRYIYTDEAELTAENVLDVLRASQTYNIPSLTDKCSEFMVPILSATNACSVMEEALKFNLKDLLMRSLVFVDEHATEVLLTDVFRKCSRQVLAKILKRDSLAADELDIFKAAVSWSEQECKKQKMDQSSESKRKILGAEFSLIRVPCMTERQFADNVVKSGILTKEEILSIFMNYACSNKEKLNLFTTVPRQAGLLVAQRYEQFRDVTVPWNMPLQAKFSFTTNKDLIFLGFLVRNIKLRILYETLCCNKAQGQVVIFDGKIEQRVDISAASVEKADKHAMEINLNRPVLIERAKNYDFSLALAFSHLGTSLSESSVNECIMPQGLTAKDDILCYNNTEIKFNKTKTDAVWMMALLFAPF